MAKVRADQPRVTLSPQQSGPPAQRSRPSSTRVRFFVLLRLYAEAYVPRTEPTSEGLLDKRRYEHRPSAKGDTRRETS